VSHHIIYPQPSTFEIIRLFNKIQESTHWPLQMDDQEFSSPVCYLDYDHFEVPTARPTQPAFCKTCIAFIAALSPNENEDAIIREEMSSEEKLKFLLNKDRWDYKTKENIAETAAEGCPLCVIILQGLDAADTKRLMAREELYTVWFTDGAIVKFKGDVKSGGIGFHLILPRDRVDSVIEVESQSLRGFATSWLLNSLALRAGTEMCLENSTVSGHDIKLPLQ
jgi:hypothetical protein